MAAPRTGTPATGILVKITMPCCRETASLGSTVSALSNFNQVALMEAYELLTGNATANPLSPSELGAVCGSATIGRDVLPERRPEGCTSGIQYWLVV